MKKKVLIVSFILLLIDLVSKTIIFSSNKLLKGTVIIKNFLRLRPIRNYGAAFSSFENMNVLLISISVIVLIYLLVTMNKQKEKFLNYFSYGLLIGGLLGNLVDRIIYGYVRDFISFRFFNYDFAIFNFADCGIVLGVILLIIISFIKEKKYGNSK